MGADCKISRRSRGCGGRPGFLGLRDRCPAGRACSGRTAVPGALLRLRAIEELADHLFDTSPFKERAKDFNVWALTVPVPVSGVSRPSTGLHRASATGLRYDIFGSERYALSLHEQLGGSGSGTSGVGA